MTTELQTQALESLQASGQALKVANDLLTSVDREKAAAAKLAAPLVDSLVAAQLIEEHDRPTAIEKLATHDGAVSIIGNLVTVLKQTKAGYEQRLRVQGNGAPAVEKAASAGDNPRLTSNSAPIVGRRAGLGEKRASDRAFIERLNLADRIPG